MTERTPYHNHMTRDIKPPGQCPGCDNGRLHSAPAPDPLAHGYGNRLMERIKAEANQQIQANLEDQRRLEWAIFRRSTPAAGKPFDFFIHTTKKESESRIERMYPLIKDQLEPRARLVSEWVKA